MIKGIQPTTIKKRIKTLVKFSNWLREKHHIDTYIKNPNDFKYINEDREVFFLTRDEVQKIKEFDEFEISNDKHLDYLPNNTPTKVGMWKIRLIQRTELRTIYLI